MLANLFSRFDLARVFSIDVRSLALVRISLAVIVLQDLARRSLDISVFYGDGGVFPSQYSHTFWNGSWAWSLHLIDGGPTSLIAILFIVHALVALALLFGFYTRIATILTWFLLVSLHNANPLILQGEDVLLRAVLFVCMFLPLGAAFSLDRYFSKMPPSETKVLSGWTVAYLLQIGFLYFFVSIYKHSAEWMSGDAIYYALSIDQYATHFGHYVLNFPHLLTFLTFSILIFQTLALFLLFSPIYSMFIRTITVFALMMMHAAFALTMNLGMFSAVSIAALCGFVPSQIWDALERFLTQRSRVWNCLKKILYSGDMNVLSHVRPMSRTQAFVSMLGLCYVVYIFVWNAGNVLKPGQYVPFSHGFDWPAKVLRLDQRWNLFAPYPYRDDGWIVIAATETNGEKIDLFRKGAPLSYDRPAVIYDLYPRPRWRRYFLSLRIQNNASYRVPLAQYLCAKWNNSHDGESHIDTVDIVYMLEWTPAPGEAPPPVRPVSLLKWDCNNNTTLQSEFAAK